MKKISSLESADIMIFSLCWDKKAQMLLAIWKLAFMYGYLKCLNIRYFSILLQKKPCDLSGLNPQFFLFASSCFLTGLFLSQSDDGGRGKSSVPSLILFACTLPMKWCSAHTKVSLMCTLSRPHKHLQNKYKRKWPKFFSQLRYPYLPNILKPSWLKLQDKGSLSCKV